LQTARAKLRARILPALPRQRTRLIGEMFAQENVHNLRHNVACALIKLGFGQVGDRVGHGQILIIRHSPSFCHRPPGGVKDIGDDGSGWEAALFKHNTIEHTARAAGASVSYPGNYGVTLGQNIADDLFVSGDAGTMLTPQ
jgi:hypothetical protein